MTTTGTAITTADALDAARDLITYVADGPRPHIHVSPNGHVRIGYLATSGDYPTRQRAVLTVAHAMGERPTTAYYDGTAKYEANGTHYGVPVQVWTNIAGGER